MLTAGPKAPHAQAAGRGICGLSLSACSPSATCRSIMAGDSGSGPVTLTSSGSDSGSCALSKDLRIKLPTAIGAKPPTNNINGGGTSQL